MKPTAFAESNVVIAKDQPEYLPLPAHKTSDGLVISRWRLGWLERLRLLFTGVIWHEQLTFNSPVQPILMTSEYPFRRQTGSREVIADAHKS